MGVGRTRTIGVMWTTFWKKKLKIGRLNQVEMYRISIREDAEAVLGLLQKNGLDFRIKIRF